MAKSTKKQSEKKQRKTAPTKAPKVARPKKAEDAVATDAAGGEAPVPKRMGDERLPPPGSKLEKRDRAGGIRCEAVVEAGGVRYNGELYRSLSAAATAAAKDLGIKGSQNGFIFWGLQKPKRPTGDLVERAEKAWQRYRAHLEAIRDAEIPDEVRSKLRAAGKKHQGNLEQFLERAA